ncbi:hypothetical protein Ahia01_000975400 [Argonauta hians]
MSAALRLVSSVRNVGLRTMKLSQPVRHGGGGRFRYREINLDHSKQSIMLCNIVGFGLWYWMMYKLYHEFDHIVGHFAYPDPSKWTDEELGIPPADEDE